MLGYNFEIFSRRALPSPATPSLTVGKRGIFKQKVLGVRPVEAGVTHAYQVRKHSKGSSYTIGGSAFVRYYGIGEVAKRRYAATVKEGLLVVDFKEGGVEYFSPRGKAA